MLSFPPNGSEDWLDTTDADNGVDNQRKRWMYRANEAARDWRCKGR